MRFRATLTTSATLPSFHTFDTRSDNISEMRKPLLRPRINSARSRAAYAPENVLRTLATSSLVSGREPIISFLSFALM
jgi:hypothetical protein